MLKPKPGVTAKLLSIFVQGLLTGKDIVSEEFTPKVLSIHRPTKETVSIDICNAMGSPLISVVDDFPLKVGEYLNVADISRSFEIKFDSGENKMEKL